MRNDLFNVNGVINTKLKEDIEKLRNEISEEKKKEKPDIHRIYRLEEQKLIQGLFNGDYNYSRFRSPW